MNNIKKQLLDATLPQTSKLFKNTKEEHLESTAVAISLLSINMADHLDRIVLYITETQKELESAYRIISSFMPETSPKAIFYPELEAFIDDSEKSNPEITGARIHALQTLSKSDDNLIIVTSIQALMQKVPMPSKLAEGNIDISIGNEVDLNEIRTKLVHEGYKTASEVYEKGNFAVRGGIIDIWPPAEKWPIRIELFGNEVESIRSFDSASQRSLSSRNQCSITPVKPMQIATDTMEFGLFHEYCRKPILYIYSDYEEIVYHAEKYYKDISESYNPKYLCEPNELLAELVRSENCMQLFKTSYANDKSSKVEIESFGKKFEIPASLYTTDGMEERRNLIFSKLEESKKDGWKIFFFLNTEGSKKHLEKTVKEDVLKNYQIATGYIPEGCVFPNEKIILVSEKEIYGQTKIIGSHMGMSTPSSKARTSGDRISTIDDLVPGDLVVHLDHGLGRYQGFNIITTNDVQQEVITIEYAEENKLHVPVTHAHLLSKYVGVGGTVKRLHKLGSSRWIKDKNSAARAIIDLASELLDTQAKRKTLKGTSFPEDDEWQHEFEASFPYTETVDQVSVIKQVKEDLESRIPMDRLICGDAGYGKTEVAIRAAFKVAMAERQVAIIVPTTILAQQHYENFFDRMRSYPLRVEMLSRFCTGAQKKDIRDGLSKGSVDIVVGTHSLLQKDISFKNLGLVVIDEEQRFGVTHKEKLKQLRNMVDILTMSATPIPRTLYMSLTGVRHMSLIQTPPTERVAIETTVCKFNDSVIRKAIKRELNRGGQIFFLHNRVLTIELIVERLKKIVPEARIVYGHGQMPTRELESIMHTFVEGRADILVSTTIIENGVDIPNANTIIIDRADRFGISDLYQLRGRVGRSNHKGYAYFLIPSHGHLDTIARKRINAVKEHSHLSAGFQLALKDLEIRGAGNILGAQQSGHIISIGFALYCQLLKRTIAQLNGEKVPDIIATEINIDFLKTGNITDEFDGISSLHIPSTYIDNEALRIRAYREMAEATRSQHIKDIEKSLKDRFGTLPPQVQALAKIAIIRIEATNRNITEVKVQYSKLMLARGSSYLKGPEGYPKIPNGKLIKKLNYITKTIKTIPVET
jgi:transcription-repair coupling factor (superfamily II helicase)